MKKALTLLLLSCLVINSDAQLFERSELPVDLNRPWEITVDSYNFLWVTEAGGIVSRVNTETAEKKVIYEALDYFDGADSERSPYCFNPRIGAGTLGLTLHPDFSEEEKAYIYFLYSYNSGSEIEPNTKFKVVRLKWNQENEEVTDAMDLIVDIPTGFDHLGGRLLAVKHGETPYLFLTVGDHGLSEDNSPDCYPDQTLNPNNQAQNPNTWNGKVHRFLMDGSIPPDNPIPGNSFYTRGHRNPQGLAYNSILNTLYVIEHGDRTDDEINVLHAGMNYGWKWVRGYHDGNHSGELGFVANYEPNELIENDALIPAFYSWCSSSVDGNPDNKTWCTVAPSDGIYYCNNAIPQWNNSLLVVTLKDGEETDKEVYQFKLDEKGELIPSTAENPNPKRFFGEDQDNNGRLRDIAISNDGKKIYLINNGGGTTNGIIVYTVDPSSLPSHNSSQENCLEINPNPSSETIRLLGIENYEEIESIEIIALNGELIRIEPTNCCAINITDLAKGTYTVSVRHKGGICTAKFIKS